MTGHGHWVAKPITRHLPSTPVAQLNFRPSSEGPFQRKDQFEIMDELHHTSGGVIYLAKERDSTPQGKLCVLKRRRVAELGNAKDMLREYELLRQLHHPNIIQCYGYFWDFEQRSLYIVLEYAMCGDLHKELKARKRACPPEPFSDREVWDIFTQILSGLHYLHAKGIVHRDIKCMNLLLTADGSVKIGDLGVSRQMSEDTIVLHSFYGTPLYLSPELVEGCPYTQMTDVWSIGVVLYELLTMAPPFDGQSLKQVTQAVLSGRYLPLPKSRDSAFAALVDKLLRRDPSRRPTCDDILRMVQSRFPSNAPTPSNASTPNNAPPASSMAKHSAHPSSASRARPDHLLDVRHDNGNNAQQGYGENARQDRVEKSRRDNVKELLEYQDERRSPQRNEGWRSPRKNERRSPQRDERRSPHRDGRREEGGGVRRAGLEVKRGDKKEVYKEVPKGWKAERREARADVRPEGREDNARHQDGRGDDAGAENEQHQYNHKSDQRNINGVPLQQKAQYGLENDWRQEQNNAPSSYDHAVHGRKTPDSRYRRDYNLNERLSAPFVPVNKNDDRRAAACQDKRGTPASGSQSTKSVPADRLLLNHPGDGYGGADAARCQMPAGVRSSIYSANSKPTPFGNGDGLQVVRIRKKESSQEDNAFPSERDRRWEERRREFHEREESKLAPYVMTPMAPSVPGDPTGLWFMKKERSQSAHPTDKKRYNVITSRWT
eukprot:GEMP01005684.1.p1 GENE.GEMP01005684.1~~GEMP01005684.1.p1  ORF type:complete len:718 (+),score=184.05 GEMP01005684.1:209-2362(+)